MQPHRPQPRPTEPAALGSPGARPALHLLLAALATLLALAGCETPSVARVPQETTGAPAPATAKEERPILRLDPGGHMALIRDLAFTPDGRHLVSASDDKTVRVWDLAGEAPARVIRGQVGKGSEGKIYAMALSPDGKTLAISGFFAKEQVTNGQKLYGKIKFADGRVLPFGGFLTKGSDTTRNKEIGNIRLQDLATGRMLGQLSGHKGVVRDLAFSPDGRSLVSGSLDGTAIVWDIAKNQVLQHFKHDSKGIAAVAFTPNGQQVVTGGRDHDLRLWSATDGRLLARMRSHTDKVTAIAVAPNGTIASGSRDHSIRLWDSREGHFLKILANQGSEVGALSFSADSKQLLSCEVNIQANCHLWSVPNGQELLRYPGHDNSVLAATFSPNGRLVATSGGNNNEVHLWDPHTGQFQRRLAGGGAGIWAVGIAPDGSRIAWGNTYVQNNLPGGYSSLKFQLSLFGLGAPHLGSQEFLTKNGTWRRALTTHGNWSLAHTKSRQNDDATFLQIVKQSQIQALVMRFSKHGYSHTPYTFTPDGKNIIVAGGHGALATFDRASHHLGDFIGHTDEVLALTTSADGRLLVSGGADQTVRLWNLATREPLLTLFAAYDGDRIADWVAWTPQGYYAASPDGDRFVGWQVNRGADQTPDYFSAAQLRRHFYRPDIVAEAVRLGSAEQAVARARDTNFRLEQLAREQPPRFQVLRPGDGENLPHPRIDLVLDVPPQSDPLERVDIFVNGRRASLLRMGRMSLPEREGSTRPSYPVALEPGENRIRVVASNRVGETARELTVHLRAQRQRTRGDLYLVSLGVSDYDQQRLRLRFAAADARAFHAAVKRHAAGLYTRVHERLLESPTADAVRDALDLFRDAREQDTLILFIAGHGTNDRDGYYFLPRNAAQEGQHWRSSSVLRWTEIQNRVVGAQGQRILFVDTCHSAAAINPRLIKDAADGEVLVFSATDANSSAREIDHLGHGIFTYALLEGLGGKANLMGDARIMLKELDTYVSARVQELSEGLQVPTIHTPGGFKDFVFATP